MENCFVCRSDRVVEGVTAQTYQENGHLVVIKGIPCLVCQTCGETYLATETMRRVESFLDTIKCAEVEIVSYDTVAV